MKLLSTLLIGLGLFLYGIGIYNIYLRENPSTLAFDNYTYGQETSTTAIKEMPVRIAINGVGIDAPILPARVIDGKWDVTEKGASYLTSSPIPGEDGNSVIYAHNWKNLFGPLMNVKTGQEVTVEYGDGSKKTFVVQYISEVSPNESTILAPSKDKRITLYTCSGFLDSKRFVAVAILKG